MVLAPFNEVWSVHFEQATPDGARPIPICLVAKELKSGMIMRAWGGEFETAPPFSVDKSSLFVAYKPSDEIACMLALNWPSPLRVLDLSAEFRVATNGRRTIAGNSLFGALTQCGLDAIGSISNPAGEISISAFATKSRSDWSAILARCENVVLAQSRLFDGMLKTFDLPRALLRRRFMAAAAGIAIAGIPVDCLLLSEFGERWEEVQSVLEPDQGAITHTLDQSYALTSGRARSPFDFAVGPDGRHRFSTSYFHARTSRNQAQRCIFDAPVWVRGLIRPAPDTALAYVDWSQHELGIAGALSADQTLLEHYRAGDAYLRFAVQIGAAPPGATKSTHGAIREQFKAICLGSLYGLGTMALADKIKCTPITASKFLRGHREVYHEYWAWSDRVVESSMLLGSVASVFGWPFHLSSETNPRTLRNFPVQAAGAEMLRLASAMANEAGIKVCALVNDAILIEAPIVEIDRAVETMRSVMSEASRIVLLDLELRTDVIVARFPERFTDPRGIAKWNRVAAKVAPHASLSLPTLSIGAQEHERLSLT